MIAWGHTLVSLLSDNERFAASSLLLAATLHPMRLPFIKDSSTAAQRHGCCSLRGADDRPPKHQPRRLSESLPGWSLRTAASSALAPRLTTPSPASHPPPARRLRRVVLLLLNLRRQVIAHVPDKHPSPATRQSCRRAPRPPRRRALSADLSADTHPMSAILYSTTIGSSLLMLSVTWLDSAVACARARGRRCRPTSAPAPGRETPTPRP